MSVLNSVENSRNLPTWLHVSGYASLLAADQMATSPLQVPPTRIFYRLNAWLQ